MSRDFDLFRAAGGGGAEVSGAFSPIHILWVRFVHDTAYGLGYSFRRPEKSGADIRQTTGKIMSKLTRRTFGMSLAAVPLAACGNGIGSTKSQEIDARADATMNYLFANYPASQEVDRKSTGKLIMPLVTEGGFFVGGGYGRGALRVGGATVDYYSTTKGSFGLQFGAQQFAHVLWFMTEEALSDFRRASGWVAGADVEYVFNDQGANLRADTVTTTAPVVAVVFGQAGALVGASLEGQKYTRIIP